MVSSPEKRRVPTGSGARWPARWGAEEPRLAGHLGQRRQNGTKSSRLRAQDGFVGIITGSASVRLADSGILRAGENPA